jgi:hypothetical protein
VRVRIRRKERKKRQYEDEEHSVVKSFTTCNAALREVPGSIPGATRFF